MLLALLFACGDPVQEYTIPKNENSQWKEMEDEAQQGEPIGQAIGKPPGDNIVAIPTNEDDIRLPGNRELPLPKDEENSSCRPIASSEQQAPKSGGVVFSGSVERKKSGPLLLEIVKKAEQSIALYSVACGSGKNFSFTAPPNLGDVYLVAFVDTDGNGPSEDDSKGLTSVTVKSDNIATGKIKLNNSISPLSMPFAMLEPEGKDQNSQQLPTDLENLPPAVTGEISADGAMEELQQGNSAELPPPTDEEAQDSLPPPTDEEDQGALPPPVEDDAGPSEPEKSGETKGEGKEGAGKSD